MSVQEAWHDEISHSVWKRSSDSGTFSPESHNGLAIASAWTCSEVGVALGSRTSDDALDGAEACAVCFPPNFLFSPRTGHRLQEPPTFSPRPWLASSGGHGITTGLVRGGKLTHYRLKLQEAASWPAPPTVQLPIPPPGGRRFLVASCGLRDSFLFSLDALHGCIYCWVPSSESWVELRSETANAPFLGSTGLPEGQWYPEAENPGADTVLFWPSDAGILAVRLAPLTQTYRAELLCKGQCMSPLLPSGDKVFGLVRSGGQGLDLVGITSATRSAAVFSSGIPESGWGTAVATPHDAIWLSAAGQVVAGARRNHYTFIPWPSSNMHPVFDFGPPYCATDGRLWQQMQISCPDEDRLGYGYLMLGQTGGEPKESSGARHQTGHSSIKVEQHLGGPPWEDPDDTKVALHDNDEAVVPLLESLTHRDVLVLRADHVGSASSFMEIQEPLVTRFQILGQQHDGSGFHVAKLHRPWETTVLIYRGCLFLYHPEFKTLPGWEIQGEGD